MVWCCNCQRATANRCTCLAFLIRQRYCYAVAFGDATGTCGAYAANSAAERFAGEREYQLAEHAKMRAAELRDEAELRQASRDRMTCAHCARWRRMRLQRRVLRDSPRAMRARIRAALKEAARLDAEPIRC
jgi:hypothetical protein